MINVTLTPDEIFLAASHGIFRRVKFHEGKREDREQKERSTWDNEIEGACAELAWCKYWNNYWTGLTGIRKIDGAGVEVKWTRHANGGVILKRNSDNDKVHVLARGFAPSFIFVGWITAREGKKHAINTSFGLLVPAEFLNSFEEPAQQELMLCLP